MKYTFIEKGATIVNGELVEQEGLEKTYTFTLKMNGLKLFEIEYGKPLIKALTKMVKTIDMDTLETLKDSNKAEALKAIDGLIDIDFIRALACSSYVKIVDNIGYNSEQTVEEFKQLKVNDYCINDIDFIFKILEMAIDCVFEKQKSNANNDSKKVKN